MSKNELKILRTCFFASGEIVENRTSEIPVGSQVFIDVPTTVAITNVFDLSLIATFCFINFKLLMI